MTDTNLNSTDKAVMLDMQVRTGTANVLQQRQWIRTMYSGTSLCECQITLEAGKAINDSNAYSFFCLTTSDKVKITFVDSEKTIHTLKVSKAIILDSPVSDFVILNEGSEAVTLSMTKLK